ncbi:MAG: sugar ABC transporter permease [Firmicutes bacterium]|nr:sugar ABC transporter permease [Bacillota bacterium]
MYVVFLLPGLILYTLFMVYPLGSALGFSLIAWDGLVGGAFCGLENFKTVLLRAPYNIRFWGALQHNVVFFAITFFIQSTLGLFLAFLFTKKRRGYDLLQTLFFLPYTLSMVVVGFLWLLLLNPTWGAFNKGLKLLGLAHWAQPWLGQTATALLTVILVNAWRWLGFPILVFKAGLQSISEEYHEAARVDGATGWQAFRHITLPLVLPTIGMVTILTFIWIFNTFELVFVMQGSSGNPYYSTDILGTFFYRTAFGDSTTGGEPGQVGIASAIAVLMFLIVAAVSYVGVRRIQESEIQY